MSGPSESGHTTFGPGDYVNLTDLDIPVPSDWSNDPEDLNIDLYFAPGCYIPATLGSEYSGVRPIITDREDTYFFEAKKGAVNQVFLWNAITGRLFAVEVAKKLKDIMEMVDISVLSIEMSLIRGR